jgi:hypothetical protein
MNTAHCRKIGRNLHGVVVWLTSEVKMGIQGQDLEGTNSGVASRTKTT